MIPTYAVIVAGGQGTRMGTAVPKQFLDLEGKPVLYHTLKAFLDAIPGIHLVLVLPAHQISYAQMVLQAFPERIDITITAGGDTRFQSVKNGLRGLPHGSIIMVHDGVRCLVSPELIRRCHDEALRYGSAIPVVPVSDSIRVVRKEGSEPIDRSVLRIVQTPQTFKGSVLLPAFEQEYRDVFTDEATVVEAAGGTVYLTEGEKSNLKITTPEDLLLASFLLKTRS